jgi:hypothetical protein
MALLDLNSRSLPHFKRNQFLYLSDFVNMSTLSTSVEDLNLKGEKPLKAIVLRLVAFFLSFIGFSAFSDFKHLSLRKTSQSL